MINKFNNIWAGAMLAVAFMLMAVPAFAQSSKYQPGVHYFVIDNAPVSTSDENIEVLEAFSYMCTHCNTFEPFIENWLERKPENVEFKRIPVIFGRRTWEVYARAYVTAEMMGIAEQSHGALMDALWKEKKIFRSIEELGEFYSNYGVTADQFIATSKSFAVDARLRKDQTLVQSYGVSGTPSLVVAGKYLIKGSQAVPNYDTMLDVVDTLIAQEQADMASTEEPAAQAVADTAAEDS
ncbi:MAG TPA: thiol:disulfide interchange protein DsbA/DsbL [Xanthomonadales bacterium]|nr:thiol:disulfide interchange protein DsbA/DsbL [Xanthomonadales bacterium]